MAKILNWLKKIYRIILAHYDDSPATYPLPESPVDRMLPSDPHWLIKAFEEVGVKEIPGSKHEKRIIEYHSVTSLKATTDEVPWCASFVCWVLEKSNITSTRSAAARSFLNWGIKTGPTRGCVVVFARPPNPSSGHVGFYLYQTDTHIVCLGGNQSNEVRVSRYSKNNLLAYRWPKEM